MYRISNESMFMEITKTLGKRSTCSRRRVGCVLVNSKNHIISTGYNGVGAGLPHCLENPCMGAIYSSGEALDKCEAIHAEQNALLQCSNVYEIEKAYITCSPCIHCAKLFLNTSVQVIHVEELYDLQAIRLLESKGIKVRTVEKNEYVS